VVALAAVVFGVPLGGIFLARIYEGISDWKFQKRRAERDEAHDERQSERRSRRVVDDAERARETEARAARALMLAARELDPIETDTKEVVARACELYEAQTGRRTKRAPFRRAVALALEDLRESLGGDELEDVRIYLRKKEQAAHARRVRERNDQKTRFEKKKKAAEKRFGKGVADFLDTLVVDAEIDFGADDHGETF